jgi:phenylalanyl-tRNA synthetase beta chain
MKVLYQWLAEFVDVTFPPEELRDRLSAAGIAIEALADTPAGLLLDAELTINRPDCLGHYGFAREVAALERRLLRPLKLAPEPHAKAGTPSDVSARVEIASPELCGRYTARIVGGVKVQPSPPWLRQRLEALGQASINNVVDATNYVMLELGQPLHAFDLARLAEKRIIVRRARAGEKIRTLDGLERVLSPEMCVIADAAHAVAIAGVMGGAESEISSATRDVLLESAWFEPISIRRTSKHLNLRTEASVRFERGADPEMANAASRRCAALLGELAGGEILPGAVDLYPGRREPLRLALSRAELLRIMGADVPDGEIEAILNSLGFLPLRLELTAHELMVAVTANIAATPEFARHSRAVWACTQPSWRQDVTREVDLIEELARHFGLDKFPPRLPGSQQPAARLPHAEAEDRLRERLIGLGYHEIVTIPLVNAEEDALFRPANVQPAVVANPLAADASLLRSTGLVSMAHALAWNINRGQRNVRLFEIGRAYSIKDAAPQETRILTIGATGRAREKGIAESAREYEFADLKGDLDQIGNLAGGFTWREIEHASWQHSAHAGRFSLPNTANRHTGLPEDGPPVSTTGGAAAGANVAGEAAKLAQRVADEFKLRQDVFLGEFALDPFYAAYQQARAARRYQPISRFPAVERDFALVLSDGTTFAAVREALQSAGIPEIAAIEAVDLYRSKQMPPGKFSLLARVTFQSRHATLTEAQVNDFSARILAKLAQQLGASLRTS